MLRFSILHTRLAWVVLALFPIWAWGQGGAGGWLLSPPGGATGQRAMSGAALVAAKGALALGGNPAEVASLRGLALFASGDFSLSTEKTRWGTQTRFLARPQLSVAWRLPEGFAVGFAYGRGELLARDTDAEEAPSRHIALHRLLLNAAWEVTPGFRLGVELQLATTENASWALEGGGDSWRGGRWAGATRAGFSVDIIPKQWTLALVWEEGLSLASRGGVLARLKTPHSVALATWVGSIGAWEFEVDLVYGWQRTWAEAGGSLQAYEDTWGLRTGLGLWLTPVIQLRAGGAVWVHTQPRRASWLQPMDVWSSSLSVGALWRYGPLRVEAAWQMVGGFESSEAAQLEARQRLSHVLSLGAGWSFD